MLQNASKAIPNCLQDVDKLNGIFSFSSNKKFTQSVFIIKIIIRNRMTFDSLFYLNKLRIRVDYILLKISRYTEIRREYIKLIFHTYKMKILNYVKEFIFDLSFKIQYLD